MSTNQTPLYTSETGVQHDIPTIVETAVSKNVRMNDPQYGLKTAAKVTHDKVARETFLAQKKAVLDRQANLVEQRKAEKIAALDEQIARVSASLIAGQSSDPAKAKSLLDTLTAKRKAIV